MLVGIAFSSLAFGIARKLEIDGIARDLEVRADDRINAVQNALLEQNRLLHAVTAYFNASPAVDAESFRSFVEPLQPLSPQLQAIGYAQFVTRADRAGFEHEATGLLGNESFRITERGDTGVLRPATDREQYSPVLYIEPTAGNEAAIGFDLMSEPRRRKALEAARDTGRAHTTSRLRLVQDQASRVGLLSAIPIYRTGAPLGSVAERREALRGFASQVYWIDEVIEGGLSALQPGGVDLYFFDSLDPPDAGPLYVHRSRNRDPGDDSELPGIDDETSPYRLEGKLDIGDRHLRVVATAAPAFVATRRGLLPWVLLAGGLLSTLLFTAYLQVSARRERQIRIAHDALEKSTERTRFVLENMPVLLIAFDGGGNLISWNRECERVTGYSAGEVLGKNALPDLDIPSPVQRDSGGGTPSRDFRGLEMTARARDGTERTIAWSNVSESIPVTGWHAWFIGIDVSEREAIQKQMLHGQKLEGLGVMAGGIAHDFNNLLTAILGNASIAQGDVPASSPAHGALGDVIIAAERAAMLTQQLLAYAGKTTLQTEAVDLSAHVGEIASLLRTAISKKVELELDLDDDLPAVDVDPSQLQQLVMNLVINGAEACGQRNGTVRISTGVEEVSHGSLPADSIGETVPGKYVVLEVRDDGVGMEPAMRARIFDPFFSTKFTGRGLGLAATVGIVRSHKGSIHVQSTPGKGSVFRVLLPASARVREISAKPAAGSLEGEGLILVVDDEPMVLRLARAALEQFGYDVVTVSGGRAAVDYFRQHGNDVACVLLDMTMPDMDGLETFQELRQLRPDVLVVLSSGYSEAAATKRFEGAMPAGFIQKPYAISELGGRIRDVMSDRARRARAG